MRRTEPATARVPHPFIYLVLILPFGVSSGYVTVTLAYQLAQGGLDAAQIAAVVAADLFPQTWKFLWAPVTDTTLTRKTWYLIGATLTAAGILACGMVPASAGVLLLSGFVTLMSVATTLVAMATEALIAHHTPDGVKGRASGWFQAGNLGGQGLGGGAGLWLAQHVAAGWVSPAALAAACASSALALMWIPDVTRRPYEASGGEAAAGLLAGLERAWLQLKTLLRDLWQMASSRRGFLALLVVFLPMGTGSASNLWAAVADGWRASADTVALINGTLGGFASMLGCLTGGFLCDRLDRKVAYVLYGLAQAACAVAMALAPHSETMFAAFTLGYAVLNGMAFAGFSAVALETIGLSAAATQYNVFASLSNMPILYMALAEGSAYARYGASAMLYTEAGMAVLAVFIFVATTAAFSRRAQALAG
jgi:MFS family permease